MTATFQSAAFAADNILAVTLSNGNRMDICITPYLHRAELSPLNDKSVRQSLMVQDGCLCWQNAPPFSVSALLSLLREKADIGCIIASAETGDDWRLYLQFQNGGCLSMEMEPLLEYSVFAPLVQSSLWKNLRAKKNSLLWEDENLRLELPMSTILRYFAQDTGITEK
ncbi:hypothetical protein [Anaerocolumna jejuensis]|uniref:hypothetical protein n=1 Tax=Anaerocolumna jejuensis TaxID=259063 RepID=UPI003F7B82E7